MPALKFLLYCFSARAIANEFVDVVSLSPVFALRHTFHSSNGFTEETLHWLHTGIGPRNAIAVQKMPEGCLFLTRHIFVFQLWSTRLRILIVGAIPGGNGLVVVDVSVCPHPTPRASARGIL